MLNVEKCPFYRNSVNPHMGKGLGLCDLEGFQTICEGDFQHCDKPDLLKKQLMEQKKKISNHERQENNKDNSPHCKVLVVDDEEPIRKLIVSLLSREGHKCVTAANGVEALNKTYQIYFDAVITDIVMPQMDGIALTKSLLNLYPNLPIMVMTGYGSEYSAKLVIEAGARDFIEKPFSMGELKIRFDKMMYDHQAFQRVKDKLREMFLNPPGIS